MNDQQHAAQATMNAWRDVRETLRPGSKEYKEADERFKKAEAEYYRTRD
jgi:hypothetical protein